MMKTIVKQGKDIQEIIEDFKRESDLDEYDFTYEIVQEPQRGFLGLIGNKIGIVHFKTHNINESIKEYVRKFSGYIEVSYKSINVKSDDKYIYVEISGVSDPGLFIGKDGKFLLSLQYLLTQSFMMIDPHRRGVILDIEGYKERQEQNLTKKVQHLAAQVVKTNKNITMDHMNAAQRRVVHKAVKDMKNVKTMTIGEGNVKRVVLCPTKK